MQKIFQQEAIEGVHWRDLQAIHGLESSWHIRLAIFERSIQAEDPALQLPPLPQTSVSSCKNFFLEQEHAEE